MSDSIRELKREFRLLQAALVRQAPFLASLLRRVRVVADDTMPGPCGVNAKGEITVHPVKFMKLSRPLRLVVWTHEALHVALRHMIRCGSRDAMRWNIAADAADNAIIQSHGYLDRLSKKERQELILPDRIAQEAGVPADDIEAFRAEAFYRLLDEMQGGEGGSGEGQEEHGENNLPKPTCGLAQAVEQSQEPQGTDDEDDSSGQGERADDQDGGGDQGSTLVEGDSLAYDAQSQGEAEANRYWARVITEAAQSAKMAGKLPLGVDRLVEDLLKPSVSWERQVKQLLRAGLGTLATSTWKRPSRRHRALPSVRWLTRPTIWVPTDTSGSIDPGELRQFFSEIKAMTKLRAERILVIPWDAQAYEHIEVRKAHDVITRLREIPGGGGTVIAPALTRVLEEMQAQDIVIVLTDGAIADTWHPETQQLLRRVAAKSSTAIFASNGGFPETGSWQKVHIRH